MLKNTLSWAEATLGPLDIRELTKSVTLAYDNGYVDSVGARELYESIAISLAKDVASIGHSNLHKYYIERLIT